MSWDSGLDVATSWVRLLTVTWSHDSSCTCGTKTYGRNYRCKYTYC